MQLFTTKKLSWLATITVELVIVWGCSFGTGASSEQSGDLVVLPDATDVRRSAENDGTVRYTVMDRYPATRTIDDLRQRVQARGWRPLRANLLSPEQQNSFDRGWFEYEDATGRDGLKYVSEWVGQWEDTSGRVLWYVLRFERVRRNEATDRLMVRGTLLSAADVVKTRKGGNGEPPRAAAAQATLSDASAFVVFRVWKSPGVGLHAVKNSHGEEFLIRSNPDLDARDLSKVDFLEKDGAPAIKLTFTSSGASKFRRLTTASLKQRLVFLIRGRVVMAPFVEAVDRSSFTWIEGDVTAADAELLREVIVPAERRR